jgi:hypothetical protein
LIIHFIETIFVWSGLPSHSFFIVRLVLQNISSEKLQLAFNAILRSHEVLANETFNDDQIYKERLNEVKLVKYSSNYFLPSSAWFLTCIRLHLLF